MSWLVRTNCEERICLNLLSPLAQGRELKCYDAVTAAGDSLVNSYLVGGLAGIGGGEAASGLSAISRNLLAASPMGVQAAGSAIRDAKLRGADDTQALMMGGATFLAETLSEAITVGNIRAAFKKGETAEWQRIIKKYCKNTDLCQVNGK